jgi:hypothetical protein
VNNLAIESLDARAQVFEETAKSSGFNPAIIEKDFWICWMLDYLFSRSSVRNQIVFKGGTSLSKGYDLIRRMSEDIDIVIDWRLLGFGIEEPWDERSNKKHKAFIADARSRAAGFLADTLLPQMLNDFSSIGVDGSSLSIKDNNPQTILFSYPQAFSDDALLQEVRIEAGALSAWSPTQSLQIASYAEQAFPSAFTSAPVTVRAVLPERTFWEKVTILHKEAHRKEGAVPDRYSRHYYDVYELAGSDVKASALGNLELLEKVIAFNKHFYRSAFAQYELAKPGTIQLVPPAASLEILKADYVKMRPLVYGEYPSFDGIITRLQVLEDEVNSL